MQKKQAFLYFSTEMQSILCKNKITFSHTSLFYKKSLVLRTILNIFSLYCYSKEMYTEKIIIFAKAKCLLVDKRCKVPRCHNILCHELYILSRYSFDVVHEFRNILLPSVMQESLAEIKSKALPIVARHSNLSLYLSFCS